MHITPELIAMLALVALVAGFIDAMAGGGGLLTIPALLASGIPPVYALGTNKLQSCFGTGGAFLAFARKGHIDFRRFGVPAACVLAGAALGAFVLQSINSAFLSGFVPALLIAMAIYFLVAPKMGEDDRHARLAPAGLAQLLAAIGFYDGFFGPGTGSFFTAALVGLAGLGMVRAIAHAKFFNFASNLAGLAVLVASGKVLWTLGFAMAAGSILGNQLGALAAMRFGGRGVRPLLVVMSLALTANLLMNPANPLRLWIGL
ncbi:TSUP family transporter [Sphingomonas sp. MMS12-HWE2-04]|uniref:TSUP family transporter n=1 Tax=Sphingomonas sp. MMS12-HWE2-04 TaxID=3234199 RepID=UPI00384B2732